MYPVYFVTHLSAGHGRGRVRQQPFGIGCTVPPNVARRIAEICRRFGVRRLAVFGSAARLADFEPERSDAEFVAFEPAASPSLGEFFALRDALAAALGRPVDLVVEGNVRNPFIRAGIER